MFREVPLLVITGSIDQGEYNRRLAAAILLSLALHLALFQLRGISLARQAPAAAPEALDLTIEAPARTEPPPPPLPRPERQIVSESAAPPGEPPAETRLLAERSTRVEREQKKQGLPAAKTSAETVPEPQKKQVPLQRTARPREEPRTAPAGRIPAGGAPTLRLSPSEVESALGTNIARAPTERAEPPAPRSDARADRARAAKLREYVPFQRGTLSDLFAGNGGVPDHLPNVPDGDVTMLNAKADRHAVFVRRVALQVFSALRQSSWSELSFRAAAGVNDMATVHAVMSPDGKLLSVALEESCGVKGFDSLLLQAARRGSWDQNPPPSARADDGNIHFVFQSRTWARKVGEGLQEQRWLLLATGLL